MSPIPRVMRVMTLVALGATLGVAAWMVCASVLVATDAWPLRSVRPDVGPRPPVTDKVRPAPGPLLVAAARALSGRLS